jgi:hypothetical protein
MIIGSHTGKPIIDENSSWKDIATTRNKVFRRVHNLRFSEEDVCPLLCLYETWVNLTIN